MTNPGRTAYAAFCDSIDWTDTHGEQMPEWPELRDDHRDAWQMTATAITEMHVSDIQHQAYDLWLKFHDLRCPGRKCKSFDGHWKCQAPRDEYLPGPAPAKRMIDVRIDIDVRGEAIAATIIKSLSW